VARGGGRIRWIAVVLVAALGGFLIGRASAGSESRPNAGEASAGPHGAHFGVPVRFARSREGAVAAMLSHGAALGDPRVLFDPERRAQILSVVATPRYAGTFEGPRAAGLEAARRGPLGQGLADGVQTLYLASPIAYRIVSYSPDQAVVEGWGVSVVGNDHGLPPQATWGKTLTWARWQQGDWRIDAVEAKDGPTPALAEGQRPSTAADTFARLSGLRGVRHLPSR
jgi:hypothetical protein